MQTEKQEAIKAFQEEAVTKAKEAFQIDVNTVLEEIATLTRRLKEAKGRFSELEYKEPIPVNIE